MRPIEAAAAALAALATCSSRASLRLIHLAKLEVLRFPEFELIGISSAGMPNVSSELIMLAGEPSNT